MTRLSIYGAGINCQATAILEGSTRAVYYTAMQLIRYGVRNGEDVPYMICTDPKLNFLLTCKRMAYNFGFDE